MALTRDIEIERGKIPPQLLSIQAKDTTEINGLLRLFSSFLIKQCLFCKKRRIENVLKIFNGSSKKFCPFCYSSYVFIRVFLQLLVSFSEENKNLTISLLKNRVKHPHIIRFVTNILLSLSIIGKNRPFVTYAPNMVYWKVTSLCNLKCRHCYNAKTMKLVGRKDLNLEDMLKIADDIGDSIVPHVIITGGEPLIRKDIFQIISRLNKWGVHTTLTTNGTLINKKVIKKLIYAGLNDINISLDGRREFHDWLRGKGVYNKALKSIKLSKESNLNVNINMVLTKKNMNDIRYLIALSEEVDVPSIYLFDLWPWGSGKSIEHLELSPIERDSMSQFVINYNEKYPSSSLKFMDIDLKLKKNAAAQIYGEQSLKKPTIIYSSPLHGRHQMEMSGMIKNESDQKKVESFYMHGCSAGISVCGIEPNGIVTPCMVLDIPAGSLLDSRLLEIWQKSSIFKNMRSVEYLKKRCHSCKLAEICGGCRARPYVKTKNLFAIDYGCSWRNSK